MSKAIKIFCGMLVLCSGFAFEQNAKNSKMDGQVTRDAELFHPEKRYSVDHRSYAKGRFKLEDLPPYQPKQTMSG